MMSRILPQAQSQERPQVAAGATPITAAQAAPKSNQSPAEIPLDGQGTLVGLYIEITNGEHRVTMSNCIKFTKHSIKKLIWKLQLSRTPISTLTTQRAPQGEEDSGQPDLKKTTTER